MMLTRQIAEFQPFVNCWRTDNYINLYCLARGRNSALYLQTLVIPAPRRFPDALHWSFQTQPWRVIVRYIRPLGVAVKLTFQIESRKPIVQLKSSTHRYNYHCTIGPTAN